MWPMRTNIEIDDVLMRDAQKRPPDTQTRNRGGPPIDDPAGGGNMKSTPPSADTACVATQRAAAQGEEPGDRCRQQAPLRRFKVVSMAWDATAAAGARNFRFLRRRGITVRPPRLMSTPPSGGDALLDELSKTAHSPLRHYADLATKLPLFSQ
jgi:hypothetical protein